MKSFDNIRTALIEQQKEFLKKYPKKPKMKIEWKMVNEKGEQINL